MQIIASLVFVLIWSTGFIVARAIGDAPQTFLFCRFLGAAIILGLACVGLRIVVTRLPHRARLWKPAAALVGETTTEPGTGTRTVWTMLLIGALVNGAYLCLSYFAVVDGFPAGIMALVGGWQPVLTLLLTALLVRRGPNRSVLLGVGVSLIGIAFVLVPGLVGTTGDVSVAHVLLAFTAVTCLSLGTIAQKHVADHPLLPTLAWQSLGAAGVAFVVAMLADEAGADFGPAFVAGLVWSVLGISVVAMLIMVHLVRVRSASYVSALVLGAPPLAALEAALLFGERLSCVQWTGTVLTLVGVGLVVLVPQGSPPEKDLRPSR